MVRDTHNGSKKRRLAPLVNLHADKRGSVGAEEYPYPQILPLDLFEAAADELGLSRQQRRVAMGRLLHYSHHEIADRLSISPATAKDHDRAARHRAGCEDCGELTRRMLALMFSARPTRRAGPTAQSAT